MALRHFERYSQDGVVGRFTVEHCNPDEMIRRQSQSGTRAHDILLVDLRERLEKSESILACYSENELQCFPEFREDLKFAPFVELRSDAVLSVSLKKGPTLVPLELELTKKNPRRYEEKIAQYYKWPEIRGVLFIAGNREIENLVRRVEKEKCENGNSKFFYAQLDELFCCEKEITFHSATGEKFILK